MRRHNRLRSRSLSEVSHPFADDSLDWSPGDLACDVAVASGVGSRLDFVERVRRPLVWPVRNEVHFFMKKTILSGEIMNNKDIAHRLK
jgi:hypothetical protein